MRAVLLSALCAACHPSFSLPGAGASVQVQTDPFSLSVRDASGREVLATLPGAQGTYGAPGATRDHWRWEDQVLEGWDGLRSHEDAWAHGTSASVVSQSAAAASLRLVEAADLDVSVSGARVRIEVRARSSSACASPPCSGSGANKLGLSFRLGASEHFFGLGERFTSVDHRGLSLVSWAEEGGLGQGESAARGPQSPYPNGPSMTYFPVPFLLSSAGYGLHIEGSARNESHLGNNCSQYGAAYRCYSGDPVGLVRGRRGPAGEGGALEQYVNDRPYVASSFLSVAIARVLGSALGAKARSA